MPPSASLKSLGFRDGPGEGPPLVAEQLALLDLVRDGAAVEVHERLGPARTSRVQHPSQKTFARPGLAQDHDAGVARCDASRLVEDRPDRRTVPHELDLSLGVEHSPERCILAAQLEVVGRPTQRVLDERRLRRFPEVVEGAQLHGLDAVVVVRLARQDDDLAGEPRVPDLPQGLQASESWHAKVKQDDVDRVRGEGRQGGLAAFDALHAMTGGGEPLLHDEAERRLVVNDEDAHRAPVGAGLWIGLHGSAGKSKTAVVPWPGPGLATWIVPPCCSIIAWQTARPNPTPLPISFVV